jgi:hypothetical protein
VIRDDGRREEAGELETAVAVWCPHHGNLDALAGKSGDASGPFSFDGGPPFQLKAELFEEIDGLFEIIDDNSDVIHSLERHASTVQDGSGCNNERFATAKQNPGAVCRIALEQETLPSRPD